jgi:hypothetical protein
MKSWPTFALLAVGLLYVIGFNLLRYEHLAEQSNEASADASVQPTPRPKRAAKAAAVPDRQWAFGGYPCRDEHCSEDWAGFRWAEKNHIADPDDCTGKTGLFIEGCRVYARQQRAGPA